MFKTSLLVEEEQQRKRDLLAIRREKFQQQKFFQIFFFFFFSFLLLEAEEMRSSVFCDAVIVPLIWASCGYVYTGIRDIPFFDLCITARHALVPSQ